jgi:hypothetical protein
MPRTIAVLALFAALAPALARAQDPVPEPPAPAQDPAAAIRAWVESDHEDQELLDRTVALCLDAGDPGMRALAEAVRETRPEQRQRRIGVESLVTGVVVEALRRGSESGMRYAGQYAGLRPLMPSAGTFLLSLVLDTPDWFPDDMRALVVPALRDVYPKGPERAAILRLREVAEDSDFEAQPLREALTYALAQWGERDLVAGRLAELNENAGEGRDTDELHFVRELAEVHYELRDYPAAAKHWQRYLHGMRTLELEPNALEFYNAACALALAAEIEAALDALTSCAALVAAGKIDTATPITRSMFETDPDLRAIRGQERFAAATKKAFGDGPKAGEKRR